MSSFGRDKKKWFVLTDIHTVQYYMEYITMKICFLHLQFDVHTNIL